MQLPVTADIDSNAKVCKHAVTVSPTGPTEDSADDSYFSLHFTLRCFVTHTNKIQTMENICEIANHKKDS